MSNETGSYGSVLKVRGVQPFLWMQFLNAVNDNVYKLVVSLLAVIVVSGKVSGGAYLSWAGFVFILPFLLFSGYAGQLADRFEKRSVVIFTKAIEILAMALAMVALLSGSIEWMLVVLLFTATQAAFFSPAKYGIVPELVEAKDLARANGLLEMSTFVAIILGTVAGTLLVAEWKHHLARIGLVLIGVALLGTLVSFRIARTPAPRERRPFSWNPFGDVASGLRRVAANRLLLLTVLGTTYFWFLGALLQLVLLLFGKERLHATEDQVGVLLMSLALGISAGSMLAGRLSGEKIELGLVPVGAAGMAAAAFTLAFGAFNLTTASLALAALGLCGGLFIVPLNAILQHRPSEDEKGRLLATANFVNTIGIMLASGVIAVLHEMLHLSAATVVAVSGVLTLGATIYILWLMPDLTVRFLLYLLTHLIYRIRVSGAKNVPERGGALLVANHVSYIDGFLIGSCVRRIVRFMVTEEYYDRFEPLFRLFQAIRVPAGNRRAVLKAIELARQALQQGEIVCIFAEGALTQTGNIGEFHRGLEKIFDGLDIPVIPVHLGGVWGSIFSLDRRASLWRSLRRLPFPISVRFGEAMKQPAAFDVRQRVAELGAEAAQDALSANDTLARRFVFRATCCAAEPERPSWPICADSPSSPKVQNPARLLRRTPRGGLRGTSHAKTASIRVPDSHRALRTCDRPPHRQCAETIPQDDAPADARRAPSLRTGAVQPARRLRKSAPASARNVRGRHASPCWRSKTDPLFAAARDAHRRDRVSAPGSGPECLPEGASFRSACEFFAGREWRSGRAPASPPNSERADAA